MRLLGMKVAMALLVLGAVFAATPVLAGHVLELQVLGRGTTTGVFGAPDCAGIVGFFGPGCNLHTAGEIMATHLGHGDFTLQIRTGITAEVNADGGACFSANRSNVPEPDQTATLTAANGDVIFFNTVGKLCQELGPGSSLQYIADYRINGGTGRFADAVGGGTLALTVNLGPIPNDVFLHMHGTIRY